MWKNFKERFENGYIPEPNTGCWLWIKSKTKGGYGSFSAFSEIYAHRASWKIFNGKIPDRLFVLHKCDTPSCVNPDHLFLGTQRDNVHDRHRKGRSKMPTNKKLTLDQVNEIRSLYSKNGSARGLAKKFEVHQTTVWDITRNKTWI